MKIINGFDNVSGEFKGAVATIGNDRNLNISDLNKFLMEKYQIRIANGYGDLKDKTFRVATMGETSMQDVDTLLSGIEAFMAQ